MCIYKSRAVLVRMMKLLKLEKMEFIDFENIIYIKNCKKRSDLSLVFGLFLCILHIAVHMNVYLVIWEQLRTGKNY